MKATLQLLFTFALLSVTGSVKAADTCEVRKLEATRMADLNIPRAGHQVFYAGGELMVAAGPIFVFFNTQKPSSVIYYINTLISK